MITKKITMLVCSALVFGSLTGCGGMKSMPVNLETRGKIALVSFILDKSIEKRGERDSGPGLLQNKDKYYQYHKAALDQIFQQFLDSKSDVFGAVTMEDVETVKSNTEYQAITKHVPKMIMGKDISLGANYLSPEGLNYVSAYDKEKPVKVATALNTQLLLFVENKACYDANAAIGIGPLKASGTAKLFLTTSFSVYSPEEKKVILTRSFENSSDQTFALVNGEIMIDDSSYPPAISSAFQKNLQNIKEYIASQKQAAASAKAN